MSHPSINRIRSDALLAAGWSTGTALENAAAFRLMRAGWTHDEVRAQHRIGRYRVDFAWPRIRLALEVDGWWHRSPEGAEKDARRDSAIRAEGWLILRVDDRSDVDEQLLRVLEVVYALYGALRPQERPQRRPPC